MKLGYNTGYWSAGPPAGVENVVAECDKLGFEHIWTAEAYGSDALSPLAWWGSHTTNVKLGTAIMQMSARTPALRRWLRSQWTTLVTEDLSWARCLRSSSSGGMVWSAISKAVRENA